MSCDRQSSGPGSVGSTQQMPTQAGSMMKFHPAKPLHMLPYFYGRKSLSEVSGLLVNKGDYLVILDDHSDQLLLCIRSETEKVLRVPIVKRPVDGKFLIEGHLPQHATGSNNVNELITYYEVYGLAVLEEKSADPTQPAKQVRLENMVKSKPEVKAPSEMRRPFLQLKDLRHFHGQLSQDAAEALLIEDGDYLVREDPDRRTAFILSCRHSDAFLHHPLEREPMSGGFALPRIDEKMPVESVVLADELLQFHVLYNVPISGRFRLVRAVVAKPKEKS